MDVDMHKDPGQAHNVTQDKHCMRSSPSLGSPTFSSTPCPTLHMRRPNSKKLSLALPSSASSPSTNSTPTDSSFSTPYTPGPPRTPALAMSMGRSTSRAFRRPSLLSLITQPPTGDSTDIPPTPSTAVHPYATVRSKAKMTTGRARSQTAAELFTTSRGAGEHNKGESWSAVPLCMGVPTITESDTAALSTPGTSYTLPPPNHPHSFTSSSSSSASASTSTTPSTSPPNAYPLRQLEPYGDGPIEILPGVWLGAEESVVQFNVWAPHKSRVRVVNVAQEVDDPFDADHRSVPGWSTSSAGRQSPMKRVTYPATSSTGQPEVAYCHVRWSHGELGLAELPEGAALADVRDAKAPGKEGVWKFWDAIRWMEEGRVNGVPVLIHCQCGVSRSATLAIAYTMALAAAGTIPNILGHVKSMQDAYDFVKGKSCWIGPNHSLVFQLVDFARNLTHLLSQHYAAHPSTHIQTAFPASSDTELTEAEWARRRREFDESENDGWPSVARSDMSGSGGGGGGGEMCMSPEEAGDEAKLLDRAMEVRRALREGPLSALH